MNLFTLNKWKNEVCKSWPTCRMAAQILMRGWDEGLGGVVESPAGGQPLPHGAHLPCWHLLLRPGRSPALPALGNINHAITGRFQMLLTCSFPREMEIAHESSARSRAKARPILRDRAWQEAPERTFICKHGLLISPSTRSSSSLWQLRLSST